MKGVDSVDTKINHSTRIAVEPSVEYQMRTTKLRDSQPEYGHWGVFTLEFY